MRLTERPVNCPGEGGKPEDSAVASQWQTGAEVEGQERHSGGLGEILKSWSLLCKHKSLSSDPQSPDEKPGMIVRAHTLNPGGQWGRDRLPSGAD